MSPHRPLVLAAAVPQAEDSLAASLDGHARLVFVRTFAQAVARLERESGIALILASIHFDESRMFDLLRYRNNHRPALPFVCFRFLESDVPHVFLEAVQVAAESCGSSLVDLPSLAARSSPAAARRALRDEVLRRLKR